MDAPAELGRNPVSNYQIQPEYGDEQADAGRGTEKCTKKQEVHEKTRSAQLVGSFTI